MGGNGLFEVISNYGYMAAVGKSQDSLGESSAAPMIPAEFG